MGKTRELKKKKKKRVSRIGSVPIRDLEMGTWAIFLKVYASATADKSFWGFVDTYISTLCHVEMTKCIEYSGGRNFREFEISSEMLIVREFYGLDSFGGFLGFSWELF